MIMGRPEAGRHRAWGYSCVWGQPNCQRKMGVVKTTVLIGGGTTQTRLRPVIQPSCPPPPLQNLLKLSHLVGSVHSIPRGTSPLSTKFLLPPSFRDTPVSLRPYDLLTASRPIHQDMV